MRKHLTYANILSTVSIFIVLGGTSYAANQLAKNSVGTRQLRNGAVKNYKVAKGTLKADRFKAGQIPQGAKGDRGDQGPQGDTGLQGIQGVAGTPATRVFASVAANGTLRYGSNVTNMGHQYAGFYQVTFDRDLTQCVALATLTAVTNPGFVNTSIGGPGGAVVSVYITDPDGTTAADNDFYLAVFC